MALLIVLRQGITLFSNLYAVFKSVCGESAEVNVATVDSWKEKLPSLLQSYSPNDIFNANEMSSFTS